MIQTNKKKMTEILDELREQIQLIDTSPKQFGRVSSVIGTVIEATGLDASVGEIHVIHTESKRIQAEVVGIKTGRKLLMPMDRLDGIKAGCLVEAAPRSVNLKVGKSLLGRVIDANGYPLDQLGSLTDCEEFPIHNDPPGPLERGKIDRIMKTGVKAIDAFMTMGFGQRIGIFAGSGVGKSTLMGMIARNSSADVNVIGLIGERGREVREFVEDVLGPEGLKRSVVVVTTSDKAAMSRVKASFTATAVAEYFQKQGLDVLLMMDSVTRVAMAQREIGLASGEPPTSKGYTPSVFSLLPKLMERAGNSKTGSITGLYTVLVDNDDMNEPIADAVRSILDGHIVLSRNLAHKNHYPAIDVLASVSRLMGQLVNVEYAQYSRKIRELMAEYRKSEDLIQIGAYVKGTNPSLDVAIEKIDAINAFLRQHGEEPVNDNVWKDLEILLK